MNSALEYLLREDEHLIYEEVRACRHQIHQYPELAMVEYKTLEFIVSKLKEYGFTEIYAGISGTGVVGVLRGQEDESILLRADMDALSIDEKSELEYKSRHPGIMHACGHDTHVAMLLGAAKVMQKKVKEGLQLKRGIKFCFQPGEENTAHGAHKIINDKSIYDIMDASPRVKNCIGFHIGSQTPLGQIYYKTGPFNANSDMWEIDIQGKGGHAMQPELTIDALRIGVQICNLLYQIKGRSVSQCNASTISIGTIKSGNGSNIISDSCQLVGTVRSVQSDDRQRIFDEFQSICDGAALQHKCKVNYKRFEGSRQIVNHKDLEQFMVKAISRVGTLVGNDMGLAGEDFFFFSDLRPSAYIIIGAALEEDENFSQYLHHSSTFKLDERGLMVGLKAWLSILQDWQK